MSPMRTRVEWSQLMSKTKTMMEYELKSRKGKIPINQEDYDAKLAELAELENLMGYSAPYSPTIPVELRAENRKVVHLPTMPALNSKAFISDIGAWYQRITDKLKEEPIFCTFTPMYEGVEIALVFMEGILVEAITRGSGLLGDAIHFPEEIKFVGDIDPKEVHAQGRVVLHGTVVMTKSDFAKLGKAYPSPAKLIHDKLTSYNQGTISSFNLEFTLIRPLPPHMSE